MLTTASLFDRRTRSAMAQESVCHLDEKPGFIGLQQETSAEHNQSSAYHATEVIGSRSVARHNNMSIILSRMRSSVRIKSQETKTKIYSIGNQLWTNHPSNNPATFGKRHDFMTATRLSGGAEQESTAPERSDQCAETPGARKPPPKGGAFLGHLDNFRKRSLELPKSIAQGSGPMMDKFKSTADLVQKTSTRVAPSFLTTLSLLYTSDKGMSVASLYAFALLGASCGFHLFLHFITIGYALGIGLPLSVALYVYNVSIRTARRYLQISSSLTTRFGFVLEYCGIYFDCTRNIQFSQGLPSSTHSSPSSGRCECCPFSYGASTSVGRLYTRRW
jgi:hypothetical protein